MSEKELQLIALSVDFANFLHENGWEGQDEAFEFTKGEGVYQMIAWIQESKNHPPMIRLNYNDFTHNFVSVEKMVKHLRMRELL